MPGVVAVLTAEEVPDAFHARYSARWRRYRYRYLDRPSRPALERGRCWHVRGSLDVDAMSQAAKALAGKHDWTSYCSASEPPDARVREMRSARVLRRGEFVELELEAELHGRELASRLQMLELRQQAVESALQSLATAPRAGATGVAPRAELLAGPDAAQEGPAAPQPLRRLREP